jgi:putative spermidine/putrescine transport system permease protein
VNELRWLLGEWVPRAVVTGIGTLALLFLVFPIAIVLPMSFSGSSLLTFPPPRWSLRWYEAFITSPQWMSAARVSFAAAGTTCVIATPLGVAAAYGLYTSASVWASRLRLLLLAPLMIPGIIAAVGIFFVYAKLGLNGTFVGLVLAHVMLAIPFVVVTTSAGLRSFDFEQERAARSLGVNRLKAFLLVTLPQIKGSVFAGMLFAFITSFDEALIALFVTSGPDSTLTKRMFSLLRDEVDPTIAAISALLIVFTLGLSLLAFVSTRRST